MVVVTMMDSKKYQYGNEFQLHVLTLALREPTFLPRYANVLSMDYFEDRYMANLIDIALNFYEENKQVPVASTMRAMAMDLVRSMGFDDEYGGALLSVLNAVYSVDMEGALQVADKVIEFGRARQMEAMLTQLSVSLSGGQKADELWEQIDRFRNMNTFVSTDEMDLGTSLFDIQEIVANDPLYAQQSKLPTGLPTLDYAFNGGLAKREVGLIIAPTGRGKSTFLVNVGAAAVLGGYPVVHFAVNELELTDVAVRYAARLTGFPITSLVNGSAGEAYLNVLRSVIPNEMNLVSHHVPMNTPVSSLRSYLSRFRYQRGISPALVVIDNTDDLASSRRDRDAYVEKGLVFAELKALAHDFDIAIWADSQANRSAGDAKVVSLGNISDSYRKAQKADVIMTLTQTDEEYEAGLCRLKVEKARRSRRSVNVIDCSIDSDRMLIREALGSPEQQPESVAS
jgi:KaiC/GvpD/RAD55 family RecA-like ATPase